MTEYEEEIVADLVHQSVRFAAIWSTSSDVEEVAEKTRMLPEQVLQLGKAIQSHGWTLRDLPRRCDDRSLLVDELDFKGLLDLMTGSELENRPCSLADMNKKRGAH